MDDIIETDCYFCDDCTPPTWHKIIYWAYDDGTYTACDDDGDHDPVDSVPAYEEVAKNWLDYAHWVLEHGEDPLSEYYVNHTVEHGFRATLYDTPDGIAVRLITTTTVPKKRYTPGRAPESVVRYLGLHKKGKHWLMTDMGCNNCRRPIEEHVNGKCLFEASHYEPMRVCQLHKLTEHTRGSTHSFMARVDKPPSHYKRELRAAARKNIRAHDPR